MENKDALSLLRSQNTTEIPNEVPKTIPSSNDNLNMESENDTDSSLQVTEETLQKAGEVSDPSSIQPESVKETSDSESEDSSEINDWDGKVREAEVDLTSQPESPNSYSGRDRLDMESEDCCIMKENTLQSPNMINDKMTITITNQPESPNSCTGKDGSEMESKDCLITSDKTLPSPDVTRGKETTIALTSQPERPNSCTGKDSSDIENKDYLATSENTLHIPDMTKDKETGVTLSSRPESPNSNIKKGNTIIECKECGGETVNSPDKTQGEKYDLPLPTQSDNSNPDIERSSTIMKTGDYGGTAVTSSDVTQGKTIDLASSSQLNSENSLDTEDESCDATLTAEHATPSSPVEAALPSLAQFSGHDIKRLENAGHAVTETDIKSLPLCPMESSSNVNSPSTESNDTALATHQNAMLSIPSDAFIPTVNQEKEEETVIPRDSPLHQSLLTPLPTNSTTQKGDSCHLEAGENKIEVKNKQKVRRGVKRKTPSASKGIQTSIHLDSNSVFHDRIVDLQMLKREAGVVCVENLQDLNVAFEEWPILLVNQLKLRDTIIESLHSIIRELVGHGQVLEQDLDYLKLKILELQQEAKKRAKENQQKTHKTQPKEAESQTTEEDLTEAWSRWYYGCWGDYYSECDPSSSSYWPGHYTQQSTVPSRARDTVNEEMQQKTAEEEHKGAAEKPQAENLEEEEKQKKKKDESHFIAKSDDTEHSEKRKKLKAKRRKERHKSEKVSLEEAGKKREKDEDTDKSTRRRKKAERKRSERRDASDDNTQIRTTAPKTRLPQEDVMTNIITKEMNGNEEAKEEEKEGSEKHLGWDTSESITQQVAAVAAQAVVDTGYVFQEELGLYYDYNTGYYYNAENGLYYDTKSGTYFYYDHNTQSYQFHSQVSPPDATVTKRRKKKKSDKKGKSKSSNKNDNSQEKEDGELTESDEEHEANKSESDSEREEEDVTSPDCHEEEGPPAADVPPSLRLMVVEGGERVRVGELHVVTLSGGSVGREANNAVHLPDLNISKVHAEIEYRSSGPEDHHYFIRDVGSNNGTFVNSVRLSEARQTSSEVEVGHGWEVQFGPIKVKCHLHPGTLTCNECEPGLVLQNLPSQQAGKGIASYKNAKCKEKARRKELKAMQKKYKLTHREAQAASSVVAPGYTDRTLLRQAQKGSDNPYEKTEVASADVPLRETNRGFTLLQKMGWSKGQGLGKDNTGRKDPIHQMSVVGKAGLGSSQPTAPPPPDPWAERRKKQLQITQERFNQC